jgi:hypothetical protein
MLTGLLVSSFFISFSFDAASASGPAAKASEPPRQATAADQARDWRMRDGLYFKRNWGVEIIGVRPASSGYMLVLRYRMLDPERAKILNDRKTKAYLIDEATGIVLAVPTMENVGELRPGATPEANRTYFMVFGNPGKLVRAGSRVSLVAGSFRADGLVVE